LKKVVSAYDSAATILDNLFAYVALLDLNGRVLEVNTPPLIRGGYVKTDIIGQYFFDAPWWSYDTAVKNRLVKAIADCRSGKSSRYDVVVKMGQELIPIDFMISPVKNAEGQIVALLPTAVDITDRKALEERLALREEQYRFVLEGSDLGFWDWNFETNTVDRNNRWAEILGYSFEEMAKTTQQWTDFVHPDDREKAWKSINAVLEGHTELHRMEYRMIHKDGSIRWILDQAKIMKRDAVGKPLRMCGTHADITERKNLELALEEQAHFDFLTGLFNRRYFMEKSEAELARSQRYQSDLSMLMIDLDHFKKINDSYGHKSGDLVLQKIGQVFLSTLREVDIAGRMGGEEFAILLPETCIDEALDVAERLRSKVAEARVQIEYANSIQVTISIGVATKSSQNEPLDGLLSRADMALYESKAGGRNIVSVIN
jgi:diguanylate cyclase (GGDEF)-like protein/PAS domain S-box-containing protein